jgi:hypothetical protein
MIPAMRNRYMLIAMLFMFSSCAGPKISNLEKGRYRYNNQAPSDALDVSVSILPITAVTAEKAKPVTFLDMRDSLPHLYLKILASKLPNADTLISRLSIPIIPASKVNSERKPTDYTEHKVQFVFSNLKKYYNVKELMHPNTRLDFLTTYLEIPLGAGIAFHNINRLQNEFDEIDFGMLSRDQTVALSAKMAVNGGLGSAYQNDYGDKISNTSGGERNSGKTIYDDDGNIVGTINSKGTFSSANDETSSKKTTGEAKISAALEGSYQNTETIKEAVAVKLQRIRTGFSFSKNKMTIAQRGRPAGDISDNVYVTATLKIANTKNVFSLPVYNFDKLYDNNNQANPVGEMSFAKRIVNFVPCDSATDIVFTTKYEGSIRAVRNSWPKAGANALEFDDKVTNYRVVATSGEPIKLDKNVYCKNAFKIVAYDVAGNVYDLWISDPTHHEVDIFIDDSPELLRQWLIDNWTEPDIARLSTTRFTLYFKDFKTAKRIFFAKKNMSDNDIADIGTITRIVLEKRMP